VLWIDIYNLSRFKLNGCLHRVCSLQSVLTCLIVSSSLSFSTSASVPSFFDFFSSGSCCRCENKALWLSLVLSIIESRELTLPLSSPAASALLPPVSVLMSPCTMPKARAWDSSAFVYSTDLLKPVKSNPFCQLPLSAGSSLPAKILHPFNQKTVSSFRTFCVRSRCFNSGCSSSCCGFIKHHWLPASLLCILVRHRRRRR